MVSEVPDIPVEGWPKLIEATKVEVFVQALFKAIGRKPTRPDDFTSEELAAAHRLYSAMMDEPTMFPRAFRGLPWNEVLAHALSRHYEGDLG